MSFDKIRIDLNNRKRTVPNVTKKLAKDLERQARAKAAWKDRTGNTRRGIKGESTPISNGANISLSHTTKVGLFHEKGTGIYGPKGRPITPKNGKYLVFTGSNGKVVFAKSVKGIPKKPIVLPTVQKNIPKIARKVGEHFKL